MVRPHHLPYPGALLPTLRPFLWQEVLFLPSDGRTVLFPIRPTLPLVVEIGSGNGDWISAKAKERPNSHFIAIERQFDRVRKIWAKKVNHHLDNLTIVAASAERFFDLLDEKIKIAELYINFPDPWPKRRHANRRLMQPQLLDRWRNVLAENGIVTFVTDHEGYSRSTIDLIRRHEGFTFMDPPPHYLLEIPGYGSSYFEKLWLDQERRIYYHRFCVRS